MRSDGRNFDELRPVSITPNYIKHAEGSVLIELGDTKVICTATVEDKVPSFLKGQGKGWITAEYSMLPRATQVRNPRETTKGKVSGRTMEIQRLIGRSLRAVVDLERLGERTITFDCDVIQADGGTRTTSVTGAFVALCLAVDKLLREQKLDRSPITDYLASVSVGIVNDGPILDLNYAEDSQAQVDMNIVMTGSGKFVEVQGTGEQSPFSRDALHDLLALAETGIRKLMNCQKEALGPIASVVVNGQEAREAGEVGHVAGN